MKILLRSLIKIKIDSSSQNGARIPHIKSLVIVEDSEMFYLISLDASGVQIFDTWHESIESALDQAFFEFGVCRDAWSKSSD